MSSEKEIDALLDRIAKWDLELASLALWLEEALRTTEYRGESDQSGHPHGYSVCPIPDWHVRQKLDEIKAARGTIAVPCPYCLDLSRGSDGSCVCDKPKCRQAKAEAENLTNRLMEARKGDISHERA